MEMKCKHGIFTQVDVVIAIVIADIELLSCSFVMITVLCFVDAKCVDSLAVWEVRETNLPGSINGQAFPCESIHLLNTSMALDSALVRIH